MGISFIQLDKVNISQDVLSDFNCGHPDFNSFLREDAISLAAEGEGVTYVLVDDEEIDNEITAIFAFATIKATALYYETNDRYISQSCAEIKYFAIDKRFQKTRTGRTGTEKYFSTVFFETLLMDLYEMSTKTIGFTGIFLRANDNGIKLYERKHFINATEYMIPYEEDDELGKCTPMYFPISSNLYSIFGVD